MKTYRNCDGVTRRELLKIGMLGGMGLSLADYLRLEAAGAVQAPRARAAIYFRLGGGPPHLDTFDMKPDAPVEYRGTLKPIKTRMPGMQISEQLPLLAACADKFTILRGVSHGLADHGLGTRYLSSGNRPLASLEYPSLGTVAAKELSSPADIPAYVTMSGATHESGYLGVKYGPFNANVSAPGQKANVPGLNRPIRAEEMARRKTLLQMVDTVFNGIEKDHEVLGGLDEFSAKAYNMLASARAREALDLTKEPAHIVERFGAGEGGQAGLLACRLVEAGSRFVSYGIGNWDMHEELYTRLNVTAPLLDRALSALLTTLAERGLLETTLVIVTGEFGRTPKINSRAKPGRDHWSRAMFVLMAGGGVRNGQIVGASDARGEGPDQDAITPDDVAATVLHALGIDHKHEYQVSSGRPIMIVREGRIIPGLFV